jgi:RNA polymerase sigma factor (sigma-70 family)
MPSPSLSSNRSTPPKAKVGQSSALEILARQYAHALARFFRLRVNNRSDVADLVQDVFLRLAKLKDLNGIDKPEQYIFTTATSALRDRHRRDAVREQQSDDSLDETRHGCSDFSPERVLAGRQAVDHLHRAIRELPDRRRDVFVLRVFEGLKMAEIARVLGISQRAAEKHYANAMAYVTGRLKDSRDG